MSYEDKIIDTIGFCYEYDYVLSEKDRFFKKESAIKVGDQKNEKYK